jgi:hypothetical protein
MAPSTRKMAIAAYKERKSVCGIYVLRCEPSGACWVGRAADIAAIGNRLAFTFAHDASLRPSLRAALRDHGRDAITLEIIERFEPDDVPYDQAGFLRYRQKHWRDTLAAEAI